MPTEIPTSVMIYEIKENSSINYHPLISSDKEYFYWNEEKFLKLKTGDVVFVVNKTDGEILYTELEKSGIPSHYDKETNFTEFSDLSKSYVATGEYDNFVRLKILTTINPDTWLYKTIGSGQHTYLLGPSVNTKKPQESNITRAQQIASYFAPETPPRAILDHCITQLGGLATKPQKNHEESVHELFDILAKYAHENIIFHSTEREASYSITEYEPSHYQVNRLDANEPVKIRASTYNTKKQTLKEHDGKLPFSDFASPVALKNTLLQSRALALSPDKSTIYDVSNLDTRIGLFLDIIKNLNTGGSEENPSLHKPAMLAAVIEAIDRGELTENKIPFDWITPLFIQKMEALGFVVNSDSAAQPFFRLTRDQIWLHAVKDVHDPMNASNLGASSARSKVKYALLKDTFWELLQDTKNRNIALETLKTRWFSGSPSARFWWVNQGKSYAAEREGGFIHAPKQDRGGNTPFHWKNMEKVQPGDLVFNYANGEIRAISISRAEPFETQTGGNFGTHDKGGWQINLDYHDLEPKVELLDIGSRLAALHDSKSPINQTGGVNQGYLFELSQKAVHIILSKVDLSQLPQEIRLKLPSSPPPPPSLDMLNSQFVKDASEAIRKSGLIYPADLLERFICSLLAKPFAILTGTSGTGKTIIAQSFAKWLVGDNKYALVAVGADWTDNRQIIGHYNPFEEKFTSTRTLDLLLRATANPTEPHFLILDEMNLSQVERYFADFLSAMESKGTISLHNNGKEIKNAHGLPVEECITIPKNLFVIGTVNIDETTHMFSPKVLDRANVIEFSMISKDLERFLNPRREKPTPLSATTEDVAIRFLNTQINLNAGNASNLSGEDTKAIHKVIVDAFKLLEGSGMEFGFRVPSEVMRYCEGSYLLSDTAVWDTNKACDEQILQKILPKLHGSRRKIERILVALASYCADQNIEKATNLASGKSALTTLKIPENSDELAKSNSTFPKSYAKLVHMIIAVRRDQFVSFVQ